MDIIANTPEPPYVAVIFTAIHSDVSDDYAEVAAKMDELASSQPGYLGVEAAGEGFGITVSYWRDQESARAWKRVGDHLAVQRRGNSEWYSAYRVRISEVVREYGHSVNNATAS